VNLGTRFFLRGKDCNNPIFRKIEINGIYSITKFCSQQKLLFLNTRSFSCLVTLHFVPMLQKKGEKVLEIKTLDPTFQILQKEFFWKEDKTLF
jgi:hypothetical protein